jgi:hypothetical protein
MGIKSSFKILLFLILTISALLLSSCDGTPGQDAAVTGSLSEQDAGGISKPAEEGFKSAGQENRPESTEADDNGIAAALRDVVRSLDNAYAEPDGEISEAELGMKLDILESISAGQWSGYVSEYELSAAYMKVASVYMQKPGGYWHRSSIKLCVDRAERIMGERKPTPFMLYTKALLCQIEGNMDEAVRIMRMAGDIARNNKDIDFWLKAYDTQTSGYNLFCRTVSLDDMGVEGDDFDTDSGILWLDDTRLLATVCKGEDQDKDPARRLILLDTVTLEHEDLYTGGNIQLRAATPDMRYVVFSDSGLKVMDLESRRVRKISDGDFRCSLSPDGRMLTYADGGVWLYNFHTRSRRKIHDGMNDASPIWYPDGRNILFIGRLEGGEPDDEEGYLQSIFKLPLDNPEGMESLSPEWKSKFHYIDWIVPGETVHVEHSRDDGFESYIMDVFDGSRKYLCSADNQEKMFYRSGSFNIFVWNSNKGLVTRFDDRGRTISLHKFGDIWGDVFRVNIPQVSFAGDNESLLFLYGTELLENMTVWITDLNFDFPVFIKNIPREFAGMISVSPGNSKAVFKSGKGRLEIADISYLLAPAPAADLWMDSGTAIPENYP